jgi:hypothetical protein
MKSPNAGAKWTREVAIEFLKAKGAERAAMGLDPAPRFVDMMPYHMTFCRLFGGIGKAQAAAGFKPRKPGRPKKEVA